MVPFSILDLSPVAEGSTIRQSLESSARMARKAEEFGYNRFWLAEHHGMPGIASAATAVVIGHVGAATKRIRIGSGGIMLPNHSPLVIAEQFGTLEALFPGRVDLGLGRAPGTDMRTAQALRRNLDAGQLPQRCRRAAAAARRASRKPGDPRGAGHEFQRADLAARL
jgi:luciferase family oxidoreductase group 1